MKTSYPTRVALSILQRLAHRNEPLAGDLLEEFQRRQSGLWLWAQLLLAISMGSFRQPRVPSRSTSLRLLHRRAMAVDCKLGIRKKVNLTGTSIEVSAV